ncbi:transcriptional regulator, TetR family [Nocardia farcinica]|uniref:Fatty acid metabolism regulator protein n=1 Tax=Nocardia farcinica TaxID=37329 RepID=A0A0H5NPQ4_NOCFR|nr:TetR/AcrR family transcriptional regulator [Nocardia farcinica]SLH58127.1 Putative transcriptional regulator, TetR family [Mycobacteroides abscessus subsp. abscessus]MBA4859189.1 helix-turn-helix transcriptional regulator [Nocardia farcinica]MBC9819029.1 helix-turn-helix transcriptional regulator [Nocardia farcinica]PFW98771.1 Fatty acid metabolism regulator protein [Nocardia farcinica]PFX04392.1 Fatty acid metabolism regulator protein [Nocardia farcinica]
MQAAYEIFTEHGYRSTTVSMIAKRAGVGQGTVYRYFDSKLEILRAVFDHTAEMGFAALDIEAVAQPITSVAELTDRIADAATALTDLVQRDPRLLTILAVEASAADPELQHRVIGLERILASRLSSAIAAGVADGTVRPDVDVAAYGHLLLSLGMPSFVDAFHGRMTPARRDRHVTAISDIVVHALQVAGGGR